MYTLYNTSTSSGIVLWKFKPNAPFNNLYVLFLLCKMFVSLEGTPLSHRGQTTHVVGGCNTDFKTFMTWDCLICCF